MTPEQTGQALRGLHPGRRLHHTQVRRHRPGPRHHPAVLPDDGRRHHGRERARDQAPPSRCGCRSTCGTGSPRDRRTLARARPVSRSATVLVIDDDADVRDLLQRFLEPGGLPRRSTAAGRRRRAAPGAGAAPAAITLDVMMPDMDGWAVLAALKADPGSGRHPRDHADHRRRQNLGFALGASEYLTKPIDRERLARRAAALRDRARSARVLVVEDDAATRERAAPRDSKQDGWTVLEAGERPRRARALADARAGLILLDLMMPEMDGFEFLEALRERARRGRASRSSSSPPRT